MPSSQKKINHQYFSNAKLYRKTLSFVAENIISDKARKANISSWGMILFLTADSRGLYFFKFNKDEFDAQFNSVTQSLALSPFRFHLNTNDLYAVVPNSVTLTQMKPFFCSSIIFLDHSNPHILRAT